MQSNTTQGAEHDHSGAEEGERWVYRVDELSTFATEVDATSDREQEGDASKCADLSDCILKGLNDEDEEGLKNDDAWSREARTFDRLLDLIDRGKL